MEEVHRFSFYTEMAFVFKFPHVVNNVVKMSDDGLYHIFEEKVFKDGSRSNIRVTQENMTTEEYNSWLTNALFNQCYKNAQTNERKWLVESDTVRSIPDSHKTMHDIGDIIFRLRDKAKSSSEASRLMAASKSLRQDDNEEQDPTIYSHLNPEDTVEWQAATILQSLQYVVHHIDPDDVESELNVTKRIADMWYEEDIPFTDQRIALGLICMRTGFERGATSNILTPSEEEKGDWLSSLPQELRDSVSVEDLRGDSTVPVGSDADLETKLTKNLSDQSHYGKVHTDGSRSGGQPPETPEGFDECGVVVRVGENPVVDLETKLRNVISHATGGTFQDHTASVNEIGVRISQYHNRIWNQAIGTTQTEVGDSPKLKYFLKIGDCVEQEVSKVTYFETQRAAGCRALDSVGIPHGSFSEGNISGRTELIIP